MTKRKINKRNFKDVGQSAIIGIKWYDGDKGLLILENEEKVVCINRSDPDTIKNVGAKTKAKFLDSYVLGSGKVFEFDGRHELFKWFAK